MLQQIHVMTATDVLPPSIDVRREFLHFQVYGTKNG